MHAVVARSTFPSQKCKKKMDGLGQFFDVQMSKKCTPLSHEAHLEVKRVKNLGFVAFFDVQMSKK